MPYLNPPPLQRWLVERDLFIGHLAKLTETHRGGADAITRGVLKEAIGGRDPIRWGRVKILAEITGLPYRVIVRPGTEIPAWLMDADDEEEEPGESEVGPKRETTGPPGRKNGGGASSSPRRAAA